MCLVCWGTLHSCCCASSLCTAIVVVLIVVIVFASCADSGFKHEVQYFAYCLAALQSCSRWDNIYCTCCAACLHIIATITLHMQTHFTSVQQFCHKKTSSLISLSGIKAVMSNSCSNIPNTTTVTTTDTITDVGTSVDSSSSSNSSDSLQ